MMRLLPRQAWGTAFGQLQTALVEKRMSALGDGVNILLSILGIHDASVGISQYPKHRWFIDVYCYR